MNKINVEGSPPPMRGKVHIRTFSFDFPRITPAYAGKRRFNDAGEFEI